MDALKAVKHYLKNTDLYLMFLALICSAYGMVLIYSATRGSGSMRYVGIQFIATMIGLAAFVIMSLIDLEAMSNWWKIFVVLNVILQLTLIPFGTEANGQRSWINFGPMSLQPAELGKLLFIFTFAANLSEIREHINEWRGIIILALHTLILMGAIVLSSKDTGMAIQYFMIALVMMFAAGLSFKWLGLGLGLGLHLHGVHGVGGSQHRQIFRKQEVAGVALGHLDHLALLALTPDILLQNHFHGIIPPYSSKYLSMARSSVVFASATVMPEHWPPAVVELPPPPSVSTSTCTLISPRERAEM